MSVGTLLIIKHLSYPILSYPILCKDPLPDPTLVNVVQSRAENIQLDFSIFCFLEKGRGSIVIHSALKSFFLKLLMKLDLAMSTFLDINLLFKIIEGFSQKGVQVSSGLGCEWIIPEKIYTPTMEGMLEKLMGEGVNSSGNLDCTHFSCYESLPKGYNETSEYSHPLPSASQKKWPLGSPVKIPFQRFLFLNKEDDLLIEYIELYCSIFCCKFCLVWKKREVHSHVSLFPKCVSLLCENLILTFTTNTEIKEN